MFTHRKPLIFFYCFGFLFLGSQFQMKPGNSKVKTNSISQIHYIIADYEI